MRDDAVRRVAVIADMHGHLAALRAVLADIDRVGVDEVVVAGDIVNFGPDPAEVVDLLRARHATMIRGNHEHDVAAPYGTPAASHGPDSISGYSMELLGAERRAFLAALPDRLPLDEATLVVHGSPRHRRDSVTASRSDADLEAMHNGEPARLVFVGHCHEPLIRDVPAAKSADEVKTASRAELPTLTLSATFDVVERQEGDLILATAGASRASAAVMGPAPPTKPPCVHSCLSGRCALRIGRRARHCSRGDLERVEVGRSRHRALPHDGGPSSIGCALRCMRGSTNRDRSRRAAARRTP